MRNITKITVASLVFIVTILSSCYRQDIELLGESSTALVPIQIDWSQSGIDPASMNTATILFYPKNGGEPLEWVSNDVYTMNVPLPIGEYSVMVFNESKNDFSWKGITIKDYASYENIAAVAKIDIKLNRNPFYVKSDTEEVCIDEPDAISVWTLDNFVVNSDMVTRTRSKSGGSATKALTEEQTKSVDQELGLLYNIQPTPRTQRVPITAKVTNLNSAHTLSGRLMGMAGGVYLKKRDVLDKESGNIVKRIVTLPPATTYLYTFNNNNHIWDDASKVNGKAVHVANSFGRLSDNNGNIDVSSDYSLQIDVKLHWGETPPPFLFDITKQVQLSIDLKLEINVGLKNGDGDQLIDLDELQSNVGVGDWGDDNNVIL